MNFGRLIGFVLIGLMMTACSRRTQMQCKNMMTVIEPTIEGRALMGEGFWAGSADYKNAESSLKSMGLTEPPLRNLRSHLVAAYQATWKAEEALLQFKGPGGGIKLNSDNYAVYDHYLVSKKALKTTIEAAQNYCENRTPIPGMTDRPKTK